LITHWRLQFTRPYSDFWMLGISATGRPGRKFFDQLAHANWTCAKACDFYQVPAHNYLGGEPIFIENPFEPRTGVVICQIFDAMQMRSAFAIFDAFGVAAGPVSIISLKTPIPPGFHGVFDRTRWTGGRPRAEDWGQLKSG
jgi:carotenoid cleavage dioxygenase-like enzyme